MADGKFQAHIDAAQGASGQTGSSQNDAAPDAAPLGGTKAEATQRLQIGFFGLASMVLLIGLATIIGNQADLTQESSVPEAAPTTEPLDTPQQSDPLADAGIVPDIPAEPEPEETEGVVQDLPLDAVPVEEGDGPNAAGANGAAGDLQE